MPVEGRPPWVPSREDIKRVAREIAEKFDPERIILFGSYAYGNPTDDSDVDLLVVMETKEEPADVAARVLMLEPQHALEVLVRTPTELRRRIELGDGFWREVVGKGEVLYDREHARVGGEG